MQRLPGTAGICLALFSAAPALGQATEREAPAPPQVRLQFESQTIPADPAVPRNSPETSFFEGVLPGVGLSRQSYREQDGSVTVRRGLVRSWAFTPRVSAGVGLFSVTHENQKEPEFRRNWSAKNIAPRNRSVAAVGLNLRF